MRSVGMGSRVWGPLRGPAVNAFGEPFPLPEVHAYVVSQLGLLCRSLGAACFVPILRLVYCGSFQGPGLMKHPGVSLVWLAGNGVLPGCPGRTESGKRRLL